MTEPTVRTTKPWPELVLYVGYCCREWPMIAGMGGKCGICDGKPKFVRYLDAACVECGNDDPAYGYAHCTDCLENGAGV